MDGTESRIRQGSVKEGNLEKAVENRAGAWYYDGIVSLFIGGE